MKLALTQFVTLDGVSQGPGAPDEDTSGGFTRGGWLVPHMDEVFVRQASDWLDHADALLLGRRTYEAFARDWPAVTDPADPFTERMNGLPKYVASTTLEAGWWAPSTVLRGDVPAEIRRLKRQDGEELQIHGSARLAHTLLAAGLVDIVRLVVAPTMLGAGRRLLVETPQSYGLALREHRATPSGLLLLEYETAGSAPTAHYAGVTAFV